MGDLLTRPIKQVIDDLDWIHFVNNNIDYRGQKGQLFPGSVTHLQEILSDSFNGTRLAPLNTALNGFLSIRDFNGRVGYEAVNGNAGNGAFVGLISRTNPAQLYQDHFAVGMLGSGHSATWARDQAVVWAYNDLFFITATNGDFDFRTGNDPGSLNGFLSVFKILNSGQVTAPLNTIAIIDAAGDKAIPTTEWSKDNAGKTSYTVATLPGSPTQGDLAFVTDATAPTYLGALTGGGAVVCPVFYNGVSWVSH